MRDKKKYTILLCTNFDNYINIGLLCNDVDDNFVGGNGKSGKYTGVEELQDSLDVFVEKQSKKLYPQTVQDGIVYSKKMSVQLVKIVDGFKYDDYRLGLEVYKINVDN
jgi:hypothetical protein